MRAGSWKGAACATARRRTGICKSSPATWRAGSLSATSRSSSSTPSRRRPDPDAALVGFCRYATARTPKTGFLGTLHADPRALDILAQILGTSPFLSEILIRNPGYLDWLRRELDAPPPDRTAFDLEIERLLGEGHDPQRQIDGLKRLQRREMLRVAARDLFGMLDRGTLTTTTAQLSDLADAIVDAALRIATAEQTARGGRWRGASRSSGWGSSEAPTSTTARTSTSSTSTTRRTMRSPPCTRATRSSGAASPGC